MSIRPGDICGHTRVESCQKSRRFLADRTNGRAYDTLVTMLRLSVAVCDVRLCIVAKQCVLEQKLQ